MFKNFRSLYRIEKTGLIFSFIPGLRISPDNPMHCENSDDNMQEY